jgi:heptosyltransferase-2
MTPPARLLIVAPNWLGDAVMALPLVVDIRRQWPSTRLLIAARGSVAALFKMVDAIDEVVVLRGGGGLDALRWIGANVAQLSAGAFDAALLLPNSFLAAWTIFRAGIPERWGFRTDWRRALLTRSFRRPSKHLHQAEYYQSLGPELGIVTGPREARIDVREEQRTGARALLASVGVSGDARYVAMAPGAAYGKAKQWLPERFAELSRLLDEEHHTAAVVVGASADAAICREIVRRAPNTIDLSGRTDLALLAGVLASADAVVANDSGAMHLAAASGARVVAVFGATNEKKTAPLKATADGPEATIVATSVWCRPCMLRECPIDHRCMTGITARDVLDALIGASPFRVNQKT